MTEDVSIDGLGNWLAGVQKGLKVDVDVLVKKVRAGSPSNSSASDLLVLAAETAASMTTKHPDWAVLGGRILLAELAMRTPPSFSAFVAGLEADFAPEFVAYVKEHAARIDAAIDHSQDNTLTFFAVRTLLASYLHHGERPQYLYMRVALAVHSPDLRRALQAYELMSQRYFIHATPTLFNAGLRDGQLASCFLLAMRDDSVGGVFSTLHDCALIMHKVGGIGLHCSNIPAASGPSSASPLSATPGIVPLLRVFNNATRLVSQGSGRRPGAISVTLEPWHADVFDFLDLRKNHGKEEYRARDLVYALWVPDLFMHKVKADEEWHLFSPDDAPGLQDCVGTEFVKLYEKYVSEQRYRKIVPARKLWARILDAQIETGNPSLLYKDSCNKKSNQQNLGVIKSSNLCTEIIEYSAPDETAVCNLASLGLPQFVADNSFDFTRLHTVAKLVTVSLNNAIDRTSYPLESCRRANLRHRPIGIGVQGLADVFFKMQLEFDGPEAATLNEKIFETIYHGALEASMELAKEHGSPYESFEGSPVSKGELQMDFWGTKTSDTLWDWTELRTKISIHGVYNSLLTAVMPTATTAQILGFTESIEPLTSNMYSRRTLSGEFQVVNQYLVAELEKLGLWTEDTRAEIMAYNGSIQHLELVPAHIRRRFKTAWELSMRAVIDQSVQRAPFVDQSQSLNLFLAQPTHAKLTSMHFHAWSSGLKTGLYYLRTQSAASAIPFTIPHETHKRSRMSTPDVVSKKSAVDDDSVCSVCT